jgi:hypothetical protein
MIIRVGGYIKIRETPGDKTFYPFGPISDIAGQEVEVIEKNPEGCCLCLAEGGLAHVAAEDVVSYSRTPGL